MTSLPETNPASTPTSLPTWKLTALLIQNQWQPYTLYFLFSLLLFAEQLVPGLILKTVFDSLSAQSSQSSVTFLWGMISLYLAIEVARLFVSIGYEYYGMTFRLFIVIGTILRISAMTFEMIPLPENSPLVIAGQAANKEAARSTFIEYRIRKAANTVRRQDADLALFTEYLELAGIPTADFANDPNSWRGITWGLVEGFVKWQLLKGYAVDSVNVRLSTVKQYAQLALKAGILDVSEYAMIRTVKGYSHKESKRIDEKRRADGLNTRKGSKKTHAVAITDEQAVQLMQCDGTSKGKRDALLMCLMIDHGLRVGEIATLQVSDFELRAGCIVFYRQKVDKTQTHRLTDRTLRAARTYMKLAPKEGNLWRPADRKGTNKLKKEQGITERGINKRVELLGRRVGIEKLSPHDLRHYWATHAARSGTPVKNLQEAGGWNSPAMPLHYIEAEQVANHGVILETVGG